LFRFKSHKTVSTSYTVQAVSNDSLHVPIKRNHNCSSKPRMLPDASEKSKPTFPNSQTKFTLSILTHSPLSTNNLNTKFHRAFSAMTVPISLSLSTPVPKLPGKTKLLQASVSRSPVQKSVKPHCSCTLPNLRCSTTHVLSPDYTISHLTHVAIQFSHEPRSLTKQKFDPPGSHATVSLSYYHLQAWRQAQ
jgi:hypothetical protein